ncbi:CRAL/TRIO domain-containing protein [Paraphaeosphaeria sporulosa]|uniref:CRAL/TRIO domain-containing protein n=1 Tax=Paraphaeosphaeria sporulosa TaxID=1460663 RepID=A0A177CNI3_9PLEO|nr:CRAL/TRIO domain-containing protein [Paraphaeosphaeria sporulosa]OAG08460.1 CRAL/TRIO domain-containing protein [Paraphaeosphaeria sporulosa]
MGEARENEAKPEGGTSAIITRIAASLNPSEATAFKKLVERCETTQLLDRPSNLDKNDLPSGINDPSTLLRFLRARTLDAEAAHTQFKEALDLRATTSITTFYDEIDTQDFDEARKLYPHWTGRFSKAGLPLCFFDIAHLDGDTLARYNKPHQGREEGVGTKHTLAVHDFLTRFVLPLADVVKGETAEGPVINCLYLVDASSLGLKQAWGVKKYAQETSALLAGSYPEVLSRVFVMNAPAFFPAAWKWIKPWIEAGTAEKLVFLAGEEVLPTLQEYIDADSIPERWGGRFEWRHGMLPCLGKTVKEMLQWDEAQEFPVGPLKWRDDGDGAIACFTGSENGVLRQGKVVKDTETSVINSAEPLVMSGEQTVGTA